MFPSPIPVTPGLVNGLYKTGREAFGSIQSLPDETSNRRTLPPPHRPLYGRNSLLFPTLCGPLVSPLTPRPL